MQGMDLVFGAEVGRASFHIPGFGCVSGLPRVRRTGAGPGRGQGMAFWVRDGFARHVSLQAKKDHCMWLRVDLPGSAPLFIGGCTCPLRSSSAEWGTGDGWVDAFEQLVADIRVFEQRGVVCLVGDFNAHTSTTDDTGIDSQQLLDAMGVPAGDPAILPMRIPARVNPDAAAVCAFGKLLLNLCTTTGCVLLNGRPWGAGDPPKHHSQRATPPAASLTSVRMNNRLGPASLIIASSPGPSQPLFLTFLWGLLSTEFLIMPHYSVQFKCPPIVIRCVLLPLLPRQFNSSIMTHGSKQSIHRLCSAQSVWPSERLWCTSCSSGPLLLKCVMPGARLCGMLQLEYLVCGSWGSAGRRKAC